MKYDIVEDNIKIGNKIIYSIDKGILDIIHSLEKENQELKKQQKEFIEYLENEINECNKYSKYIENKLQELKSRIACKTYIANEIMKNEVAKKILKEILSKYKEIIGVLNEKINVL